MAVCPPSSPSGTSTVSEVGEALASRAGSGPRRTCGTPASTGKPSPSSVTRPPSIAQSGRTDVSRPMNLRSLVVGFCVELDVPVEIIAPRLRRVAQSDRDADRGRLVGSLGNADEMHTGLLGSTSALAAVAGDAAGDDVFPILSAALGDRHDMIEGKVRRGEPPRAVLTAVIVARVDVGARERYVVDLPLDFDIAQQADDRRQLEGELDRVDLAVVRRDDLDLPLAPERNRLLPVDDLQRLVRGVQQERLLHKP